MPRTPVQSRSKQKKCKIIISGMKLFAQRGFYDCPISAIAEDAEISIGTFYSYFKDKDKLLEEISAGYGNQIIKGIYGNIEESTAGLTAAEGIDALIKACIDAHSLSPGLHKEICALSNRIDYISKLNLQLEKSALDKTRAIIKHQKEHLRIKNIEPAAQIIHAAIEKTIHTCLIEKEGKDLEAQCAALNEMICRYLFSLP